MYDEAKGRNYCDAGRTAFFGGRWKLPCATDVDATGRIHVIYAGHGAAAVKIELCDKHFDEVNRAGLVTEPYAGRDAVRERTGIEDP
jgi:cyanophycinase-like exopeptidase